MCAVPFFGSVTLVFGEHPAKVAFHSDGVCRRWTPSRSRVQSAGYAARACCRSAFQCQGRSSCSRVCGCSAMRARTSASQALGVDVVELGRADQGVHHSRPLAAAIGAREEP